LNGFRLPKAILKEKSASSRTSTRVAALQGVYQREKSKVSGAWRRSQDTESKEIPARSQPAFADDLSRMM
jgi:hypothetical protein